MGTWGTGILQDDFAAEVASSFVERLYAGADPQEATERVIEEYGELDLDERSVFWLSLARVQLDYGRLVERVEREALAILASGEDLAKWNGEPRRARVLSRLRRALEGPRQPPKRLSRRPPQLREGDVFRLPLGDGRYGFGRVLTESERAFYAFTAEQKRPPVRDVLRSEVLFVVGSTDDGFARRQWVVIANEPLEERLRQPIYFYHQAVGSERCTVFDIWDPGSDERRPASECVELEQWAAWSATHCRDRVDAALGGQPCRWTPRGRSPHRR